MPDLRRDILTIDRHDTAKHPQANSHHAQEGPSESRMQAITSLRGYASTSRRLCTIFRPARRIKRCTVSQRQGMGNKEAPDDRLCPIFMVSNVTGHNLPMLRTFLNCLGSSQNDDKYVVDAPFEFQISDVFSVPFVGTVVVSPACVKQYREGS